VHLSDEEAETVVSIIDILRVDAAGLDFLGSPDVVFAAILLEVLFPNGGNLFAAIRVTITVGVTRINSNVASTFSEGIAFHVDQVSDRTNAAIRLALTLSTVLFDSLGLSKNLILSVGEGCSQGHQK
jgi:hypothetical protein